MLESDIQAQHTPRMIVQTKLVVKTRPLSLNRISAEVEKVIDESQLQLGLCTLFVQHTSASLVIQENADPLVCLDLQAWISELAPQDRNWEHDDEGPDDMPAHAKSAITQTSLQIPFNSGGLCLGLS